MCESLVWDRHIIGKGFIKAGLNWVEGLFAWPLMGDQRAGDPALTASQRQAITCLSALCINPSGVGILAVKGRQRGRRAGCPRAELARLGPLMCSGQGSWIGMQALRMLMGTGARQQGAASLGIPASFRILHRASFLSFHQFPACGHISG